eukprot:2048865-Pleurochrysis_carterae.AAC.1
MPGVSDSRKSTERASSPWLSRSSSRMAPLNSPGRVAGKLTRLPEICDRGFFLSAEFSRREEKFRQFS